MMLMTIFCVHVSVRFIAVQFLLLLCVFTLSRSFLSLGMRAENQEKFFLYLFISVTAGVLLCLTLVIGRLVIQKRQLKSDKKTQSLNTTGEMTIPNGFSDDISEIDADIDMATSMPVPSVSRSEVSSFFFLCILYIAYRSRYLGI